MWVPPDGCLCCAARTALLLSSPHPVTSNLLPQIANGNKKKCKTLDWEAAAEKAEADTENQHLRQLAHTKKYLFVCFDSLSSCSFSPRYRARAWPHVPCRWDRAPRRRGAAVAPAHRQPGAAMGHGLGKPGSFAVPVRSQAQGRLSASLPSHRGRQGSSLPAPRLFFLHG